MFDAPFLPMEHARWPWKNCIHLGVYIGSSSFGEEIPKVSLSKIAELGALDMWGPNFSLPASMGIAQILWVHLNSWFWERLLQRCHVLRFPTHPHTHTAAASCNDCLTPISNFNFLGGFNQVRGQCMLDAYLDFFWVLHINLRHFS